VVKFDLRPAGSFRIEIDRPEQSLLIFCTYQELSPPLRLKFTWAWEQTRPDPGRVTSRGQTLVTVDLQAHGRDATDLVLVQGPYAPGQQRDRDTAFWKASLDALAHRLEQAAPSGSVRLGA
jgi:uncharacterized protein YndB with AHSA1/START domain